MRLDGVYCFSLSCPAKAGHPVITENLVVTGSPAFAGDDDREVNDPRKNHHTLGIRKAQPYRPRSVRGFGSFCFTRPISFHGSCFRPPRRLPRLSSVYWLPPLVRPNSSHVTGADTGAPSRARVEYAATEVCSNELRR